MINTKLLAQRHTVAMDDFERVNAWHQSLRKLMIRLRSAIGQYAFRLVRLVRYWRKLESNYLVTLLYDKELRLLRDKLPYAI